MREVKVIFKDANPKDPLTVYPTVGVRAEIAGKIYGNYVELDYEPSAEEVCDAVQYLLEILLNAEEGTNHENKKD
jgi:hypothetical protein